MAVGCGNAIFSLRTVIDYFRERGSTVYASSLDVSKAFDNVNHYKLFTSLLKAGFPGWVMGLLSTDTTNWLLLSVGKAPYLTRLLFIVVLGRVVLFLRLFLIYSSMRLLLNYVQLIPAVV